MTVKTPPVFMQSGSYVAQDLRQMLQGQAASGVIKPNDFIVTAGGGMSVNVSAGTAFVAGTETTTQGTYFVTNDAPVNLVVAASNATNARNDLVVLRVRDAAISGAFSDAALVVVTGVAAGSPVDPAIPADSVVLARLVIPALAASVIAGYITDIRAMAVESWPSQATTGLVGAQAGGRYVGATASGPPTTGAFLVGDVVIDRLGSIHVCQTAGTPGTWSSPPMGSLGYAQITANVTGITGQQDVSGLAVTVTVGTGRRIRVSAFIAAVGGGGADTYIVNLWEGATQLTQANVINPSGGSLCKIETILTPTAGSHTYKVGMIHSLGSTAGTIYATGTYPAYILVEDLGL